MPFTDGTFTLKPLTVIITIIELLHLKLKKYILDYHLAKPTLNLHYQIVIKIIKRNKLVNKTFHLVFKFCLVENVLYFKLKLLTFCYLNITIAIIICYVCIKYDSIQISPF